MQEGKHTLSKKLITSHDRMPQSGKIELLFIPSSRWTRANVYQRYLYDGLNAKQIKCRDGMEHRGNFSSLWLFNSYEWRSIGLERPRRAASAE